MNSSPNNHPNCKKDHIRTRIPTDPNSNAKTSWYKNMAPMYNSNTTDLSMSGLPTHNYPRYKRSNRYYPKNKYRNRMGRLPKRQTLDCGNGECAKRIHNPSRSR